MSNTQKKVKAYFDNWQRRNAAMRPVIVYKWQSVGWSFAPTNYVMQLPYNKLTNI